jgi:hypothetical protein
MNKHVTSSNDYKVSIKAAFAIPTHGAYAVITPAEKDEFNYADHQNAAPTQARGFKADIHKADSNIR